MGGDLDMSHPRDSEKRYPEETDEQTDRWPERPVDRDMGGERGMDRDTGGERQVDRETRGQRGR